MNESPFRELVPGEQIIYVFRKHPFVFMGTALRQLLVMMLFFVMPLLIFDLPVQSGWSEGMSPVARAAVLLVVSLVELFLWLSLFISWLEYYLDVWIVTNKRLINVDQRRLFSRSVSELPLEKIQDCTSDVRGVMRTIFRFGDIDVQTAGEEEKFTFKNIPDPEMHRSDILRVIDAHVRDRSHSP